MANWGIGGGSARANWEIGVNVVAAEIALTPLCLQKSGTSPAFLLGGV